MSGLVTTGYEGRDAAEVVALLRQAGVARLVDVRATPLSRKPGLSKNRLAAALAEAGIAYEHRPELGVPKPDRDAFRRGDAAPREALRGRLRTGEGAAAVAAVTAAARAERVALLCFEADVAACHRGVVAEEILVAAPDLPVTHL
ncbi:MAG TPA: DUF488 domain-containing protein [Mycobacteriales bacterium]|nr:DUF488 domain-containing protein [Mycobacteriales bacterium]